MHPTDVIYGCMCLLLPRILFHLARASGLPSTPSSQLVLEPRRRLVSTLPA